MLWCAVLHTTQASDTQKRFWFRKATCEQLQLSAPTNGVALCKGLHQEGVVPVPCRLQTYSLPTYKGFDEVIMYANVAEVMDTLGIGEGCELHGFAWLGCLCVCSHSRENQDSAAGGSCTTAVLQLPTPHMCCLAG